MPTMSQYYSKIVDLAFSTSANNVKVKDTFYGQMDQIKKLLRNDRTALVSPILEFMINSATVPIAFNSDNTNLNKLFLGWSKNVNANLNIDIPRGLRSFTEQYFRERWKSSFIGVRIRWGKIDGFIMPTVMHIFDGSSLYAKDEKNTLNSIQYYLGKPKTDQSNLLRNTQTESILIRKPYNSLYEKVPTPYLVYNGALEHALKKSLILDRQNEIVKTAFPYQFFIKAGTEEMLKQKLLIDEEQLTALSDKFQQKKSEYDTHVADKGLVGAFPFHVKFEELIPDYLKALDEKILKGTDKNLLSALGLIELKGFSTTREEAILNPKVLVEEVTNAVADYVELLNEIVVQIKERNSTRYKINDLVEVSPGIIESFITDDMRSLMRSLYDRGLISKQDMIEGATMLKFKTQVVKRDSELKGGVDVTLYPPVTQNQENNIKDTNEDIPLDKKPDSPESENFKNASDDKEPEYITSVMKNVRSIPQEIKKELSKAQQQTFKKAFNKMFEKATDLGYDDSFREKNSLEYACEQVFKNKDIL